MSEERAISTLKDAAQESTLVRVVLQEELSQQDLEYTMPLESASTSRHSLTRLMIQYQALLERHSLFKDLEMWGTGQLSSSSKMVEK